MTNRLGWIALAASLGLCSFACVAQPEPDESDESANAAQALNSQKGSNGDAATAEICHIPPGNPEKAHTITVGESAVQAHLAHGDHVGACGEGGDGSGSDGGDDGSGGDPGPVACGADGSTCSADGQCCGGLCGGSGVCVSACTVGPELGGSYCDAANDCCDGACLFGSCWAGETCHLPGTACTDFPLTLSDLCCFGTSCINGTCQ